MENGGKRAEGRSSVLQNFVEQAHSSALHRKCPAPTTPPLSGVFYSRAQGNGKGRLSGGGAGARGGSGIGTGLFAGAGCRT
jgi:hypothetical protein